MHTYPSTLDTKPLMWAWLLALPGLISASTSPVGPTPRILAAIPEDFMVATLAALELADLHRTSYWCTLCDRAVGAGYGTQESAEFVAGVILAGRAAGELGLRPGGSFDRKQGDHTTAKDEFIMTAINMARQAYPAAEDSFAIKWASETGHTEVVKLLLDDKRADPATEDSYAIRLASLNGHTEAAKLLLNDKRVNPAVMNNHAIRGASRNGHTVIVKLLLDNKRADPAASDNFAIESASEKGHTEIVKLLLGDSRVDPAAKDNYAISWASENGHTGVVKLLLDDRRAEPAAKDSYAIKRASENGHPEIVSLLLDDRRADPAAEDSYAIRWASKNGHTKVVRLLLDDGRADPAAEDSWAIIWASINGHTDIVKLLLDDPRTDPATSDSSALKWACSNGYPDIVKLLLDDRRADPAANGSYAIKNAICNGHTEAVKLLLDDPRVDPYQIDMQNACAAVKQELKHIRDIPRSVLEACSLGPLVIPDQLEEDEVKRLRDARNRLELEVVTGHVQSSDIISALSVPQFGVLFCRAGFSPVIMLSLLQNYRHADGLMKVPLDDHISRKFIERRKPAREILNAAKDILSMQLASVSGFDPESISLPDEIIARIMGLL